MLRIELNKENQLVIIKLSGKFDTSEVHNFENVFMKQLKTGSSVIALKLKDLSYIDSSGIGSLVRCMNMAIKNNIEFLCYEISPNVEKIFKLARLDQFIKVLSEKDFYSEYSNNN